MLFDLRGGGRRRTVKVIYLGLAILMGGGFVLFGIGGATSGGLIDAIQRQRRARRARHDAFQQRVDALEKRTRPTRRTRPPGRSSPAALPAGRQRRRTTTRATGAYTAKGKAAAPQAAAAWQATSP